MDLKAEFTRKLGPLPVWGWAALAAGGLGIYVLVIRKPSTPTTGLTGTGAPIDLGAGGSGGAGIPTDTGAGGGGTPTPTPIPGGSGGPTPVPIPVPTPSPSPAPQPGGNPFGGGIHFGSGGLFSGDWLALWQRLIPTTPGTPTAQIPSPVNIPGFGNLFGSGTGSLLGLPGSTFADAIDASRNPALSPGAAAALANPSSLSQFNFISSADANNPADIAAAQQFFFRDKPAADVASAIATRQITGQDPSLLGGRTGVLDPLTNSYSYTNNPVPANQGSGAYTAPLAAATAAAVGNPDYVQPGQTYLDPNSSNLNSAGQAAYYDPSTNKYVYK